MSRSLRRRRRARTWLAAVAIMLLVPGCLPTPATARRPAARPPVPAAAQAPDDDQEPTRLEFAPPVDAEISDGWRPPSTPYGPGNRGWEYDTAPGDEVRAAGDGTVTFAGAVGGSFAVTLAHVGGLTTSYSYLDGVDVLDGQRVSLGARVGSAGEVVHFGVRLDGVYADPAVLFRAGALRLGARLLPRSGRRRRSATLTRRPVRRPARDCARSCAQRTNHQPAPGPPTVASRAGPGTSNRWEGRTAMAVVSMKQLLEAGVHFGHQTRRWNPKMKRFIHGEKAGIYIIDLKQTLSRIEVAYNFVRDLTANSGTVLFVGTKKQAQDSIQSYAERCNMPYVNERWLGGMLTNFDTMAKRVSKMKEYQRMRDSGEFEAMPKKEALLISRELEKLERNLGGIRNMTKAPDAVFILDTKKEHIAVTECNKLGIPIIAVVDTNCDPDVIQYVIPGNDDAIRSGQLMARIISDAVQEGRFIASRRGGGDAGPRRTAEEEAAIAQQQAEARAQAAAQQAARDARVAAARATPASEASDETGEAAAETAETGEAVGSDEGPATESEQGN